MYTAEGDYVNIDLMPPILKGRIYDKFKSEFIEPLDRFSEEHQIPVALMTLPVHQGKMIQKALFEPLHQRGPGIRRPFDQILRDPERYRMDRQIR